MAKKPKPSIKRSEYVKGLSTEDILKMDNKTFNKLSENELRHLVTRLASSANKRVKAFEQKGERSPAYNVAKRGGKFTAKGKDLNALRSEFLREKSFLQSKVSTVSGWKKTKQRIEKGLAEQGVNVSDELFDIYSKLRELDKTISQKEFKYEIMKEIEAVLEENEVEDGFWDELTDKEKAERYATMLYDRLDEIIGRNEETRRRADSTSDFFEF